MFPESTELLLIGCVIESSWTPRSKSNTLTPRTNSQTYWPREISHVMNGIIFCVCSTSGIPVPLTVSNRCRKEHKKMQVKKRSQQNQSRWWIWYHDTLWGIRACLPRLHLKALGTPNQKVRTYLWARWICSKQVLGDPYRALAHQTTQNGTLTTSGLLKCVEIWWNVEHKYDETRIWQVCHRWWYGLWHRHRIEPFSEDHDHSWTEWMIDCERCWTVLQKMQCKTSTNVLWFGECVCLRHWKHLYSWERITQTI